MAIDIQEELPTASEYKYLRSLAGWGNVSEVVASKALGSTAISLCVRYNEELVGLGRVVGDNALYYYVSDVFVHPNHRGRGLGEKIVLRLVERVKETAEPGATVAILSAPGRESFYERAGFECCPNEIFGAGMAFLEPIQRQISQSK